MLITFITHFVCLFAGVLAGFAVASLCVAAARADARARAFRKE